MVFMEWQNTFVIGINEFDDHHKHLIGIMNELYNDIASASSPEALCVVSEELVDYASFHFQAEENWMKERNYTQLSKHQLEHIVFTNKVNEINNHCRQGDFELSIDLLSFLMDWLINHILETDALYGKFAS